MKVAGLTVKVGQMTMGLDEMELKRESVPGHEQPVCPQTFLTAIGVEADINLLVARPYVNHPHSN